MAAALRAMGLQDEPGFIGYYQVFNRAVWSPRRVGWRLLLALIRDFAPTGSG